MLKQKTINDVTKLQALPVHCTYSRTAQEVQERTPTGQLVEDIQFHQPAYCGHVGICNFVEVGQRSSRGEDHLGGSVDDTPQDSAA